MELRLLVRIDDLCADESKCRPIGAERGEDECDRDEDQEAERGRAVPGLEHGPDCQVGEHASVDHDEP
jgi:hypothetical protein